MSDNSIGTKVWSKLMILCERGNIMPAETKGVFCVVTDVRMLEERALKLESEFENLEKANKHYFNLFIEVGSKLDQGLYIDALNIMNKELKG